MEETADSYLVRGTAAQAGLRFFAAYTTAVVEEARQRHDTLPTATAALGRVLTAAALLAGNLKEGQALTLRVLGDGPLGALVATAEPGVRVRGYVQNPAIHLPSQRPGKLDVGSAVGKEGLLAVSFDLGLKEPYVGSVPLVSGEIAEDLTRYLVESEQTPSAVSLGVLVDTDGRVRSAGGYILQLLPGAGEELAREVEDRLQQQRGISWLLDEGQTIDDVIATTLKGLEPHFSQHQPVVFSCKCSRERLQDILVSLGRKELTNMLAVQGQAEVQCHFCAEKYIFSDLELKEILDDLPDSTGN